MSELWKDILALYEERAKRPNYPDTVCAPCGKIWGRHDHGNATTWHIAKCGICGESTSVTEPRDFGHLRDGWQR